MPPPLQSCGRRLGALTSDPLEGCCSSPTYLSAPSQAPWAALHGGIHWQQHRGLRFTPRGHCRGERTPQGPCGGLPRQHRCPKPRMPSLPAPHSLCCAPLTFAASCCSPGRAVHPFTKPHVSFLRASCSVPPDPSEAAWCSPDLGRSGGLFGERQVASLPRSLARTWEPSETAGGPGSQPQH